MLLARPVAKASVWFIIAEKTCVNHGSGHVW